MASAYSAARHRFVALGLAFMGQWSNSLVVQVLPPLAPLFQPELGLSKAQVGFFSTAGFFGAWGVLLVAGALADRFGVRTVMSLGQVVGGVAMMSMAVVGSFPQALLVMIAAGVSRGMVAPSATKAVVDWFDPRTRATAMGVQQSAVPISGILLASTMPALGLTLGWRAAVSLVGLMLVVDGLVAAVFYRDVRRSGQTASAGYGTRSALRAVIRTPNLWSLGTMALLVAGGQIAITTYMVLYFQDWVLVPLIPDESSRLVAAGGYLAICQVGGVFSRFSWGILCNRLFRGSRIATLAVTAALGALASTGVASVTPGHHPWVVAAIVFIAGAAAMGWAGLYFAHVAEMAGPAHAATSLGLNMTILQLGTVAGAPLFGFVVDLSGSYQVAWTSLAGAYVVATVLALISLRGEAKARSR